MRTIGVEEEYLLVGPEGDVVGLGGAVLAQADPGPQADATPGGDLEAELKQQMIETGTRPCTELTALADEVREGRRRAADAAARVGAGIAALATAPQEVVPTLTPGARYHEINREFALTAREQLTCGCHVHVGIEDDEEGVAVLDRIAPWLPVVLALSSNSPFWRGQDSGYASFRSQVWNRWPTAGPVPPFGSARAYHDVVDSLIGSGAILDEGMIYFDARLSARYPTAEVRIADVCLDADDTTLVAALVRGLVETAARDRVAERPGPTARVELLRASTWRAGRSGLSGQLVHPVTFQPVTAREAVAALVDHTAEALADAGDLDTVQTLLERLLGRGTGATRQRAWLAGSGDLSEVVRRAAEVTTS